MGRALRSANEPGELLGPAGWVSSPILAEERSPIVLRAPHQRDCDVPIFVHVVEDIIGTRNRRSQQVAVERNAGL